MAEKTIAQLESELESISAKTKKSYDTLNSRTGLYKKLAIARETVKKKGLLPGVKEETQAEIKALESQIQSAEAEYNTNQTQKNAINKQIKQLKNAEQKDKTEKATAKGAGNVYDKALEQLKTAELGLEGYKGDTKYQDAYRKAEVARESAVKAGLNPAALPSPKIEVPKVVDTKTDETGKTTDGQTDDITAFFSTVADPKNSELLKAVQSDLATNFGYSGPVDGKYSLQFQAKIGEIATNRGKLPASLQGSDLRSFLASKESARLIGTVGGAGGGGGTDSYTTISPATTAATYINAAVKSLLGREATPEEVKGLTALLNDAESKQRVSVVNGVTKGGVGDRTQFIVDLITSGKYKNAGKVLGKESTLLKDFSEAIKKKKLDASDLTKQTLQTTINDNGLSIDQAKLDGWAEEVKNGKDIKTVQNQIRMLAATGMPDNVKKMLAEGNDLADVYAPYKTTMASILELDPNSIKLTDPTLVSAIGPAGETPIYEFKNKLRQDSRWQYTNNAREAVSSGLTQVLRDFGFMG